MMDNRDESKYFKTSLGGPSYFFLYRFYVVDCEAGVQNIVE